MRLVLLTLFACLLALPAYAGYSGGTGTAQDAYQIATAADLLALGRSPDDYDKHFLLTADIDLAPNLPGGQVYTQALIAPNTGSENRFEGVVFSGCFDGNDHIIANLSGVNSKAYYLGLFGNVGKGGRIRNLRLEDITIRGADRVGGIAGHNGGTISNCHVSGQMRGNWYVGGLVGRNEGTLDGCQAEAQVSGGAFLGTYGGLVGYNDRGTVTNCTAVGEVSGHGNNGGLIGENNYGPVMNCHAAVDVEGESGVGGLIGGNSGTVARCSAIGNVSGGDVSEGIGGLVGEQDHGTIVGCSASGAVTGSDDVGGLVGSNSNGRILNCSATGSVVGAGYFSWAMGGLVGNNYASTVANCWAGGSISVPGPSNGIGGLIGHNLDGVVRQSFWDVQGSGLSQSAGGMGLTREQMHKPETFLAAGWDLVGERANGTADLWLISEEHGCPVLALVSESYTPHTLEGSGTSADPYRIATAEDLGAVCCYDWGAQYSLTVDIDLSGITWSACPIWAFGGTLRGGGHRISDLTLHGDADLGLIGWLYEGALVQKLGLERIQVLGDDQCDAVGGLAGISQGDILACYVTGRIAGGTGSSGLGGLVGSSHGKIVDCYASVSVWADGNSQDLGGLVGRSSASTVIRCYAVGAVTAGKGSRSLGGLVGSDSQSAIRGCFWDVEASGVPVSAAGMGLTTAQMKTADRYSVNGWAAEPNWVLDGGKDYPRLTWEGTAGQVITRPALDWLTGAGTKEDPYRIMTPAQLEQITRESVLWDKAFILLSDLDLTGVALGRIGLSSGDAFTGCFDGGGHILSNMDMAGGGSSASNQGLFGAVGPTGQVRGVRLENVTWVCADSTKDSAILVGVNRGTIEQCLVRGRILAADNCNGLGGLVGTNEGTIRECHAAVSIEAGNNSRSMGGLVARNYMRLIDCHAAGDILAGPQRSHLGGLVGYNEHMTGGRATAQGWEDYIWEGAITRCYATGRVSGEGVDKYAGGLVGGDWKGAITSSYFLVSPAGVRVGEVGLPLTEEQMKHQACFSGWDFENIWTIRESESYPQLRWETAEQH